MRHVILGHDRLLPAPAAVEAALEARGFVRWNGTGDPDIAVLNNAGPKGDFFEAGFWAGRGAHVFFLGGGSRCHKRKHLVGRFGGWSIVSNEGRAVTVEALVESVERWLEARGRAAAVNSSGETS